MPSYIDNEVENTYLWSD